MIAPDVYAENVQLTGKNLVLHGQGGALGAIIDGQGVGPCLSLTAIPAGTGFPETWVSGLTFIGGAGTVTPFGTAGGAVYCADSDTHFSFAECMFLDNISPTGTGTGRGGALYAVNCDRINMLHCALIGNVAEGMTWLQMVDQKLIDAFVVDASDQSRLESASGISVSRIEQPLSAEHFGVVLALGRDELMAAMNRAR